MTIGRIAFIGSGEISLAGGRVFEKLARHITSPINIAILETPAGFEPNSAQVAGRVADFLATRLAIYKPEINVIAARKLGTPFSPNDPEVCAPLLRANLIFMGPGSPSYVIRQLRDTLAWQLIQARYRLGATIVFASAATIGISKYSLPIYEIFKVGQDVHCLPGLDFFGPFGLSLSFVPHWNNGEGGAELDTSRCFIGMDRFNEWAALLPAGHTVLGLDEHTGIIIDPQAGECSVAGVSSVTLLRDGISIIHPAGSTFKLSEVGTLTPLSDPSVGIPPAVWQLALSHSLPAITDTETAPLHVQQLAVARQTARDQKDWLQSDALRRKIEEAGWAVQDTPDGWKLNRA